MESKSDGARLIPEDHPDFQAEAIEILLGETAALGRLVYSDAHLCREMHRDRRPRGGLFDPLYALGRAGLAECHAWEDHRFWQESPRKCVDMSGNSYQKYKMQRISKKNEGRESGQDRHSSVRVTVSEKVARKIQRLSDQTRIPSEVVAAEVMARGFALLKS